MYLIILNSTVRQMFCVLGSKSVNWIYQMNKTLWTFSFVLTKMIWQHDYRNT